MATILDFDEINKLGEYVIKTSDSLDTLLNNIEDILITTFIRGVERGNYDLETDYEDYEDDLYIFLNEEVAGKSWQERVTEYYNEGIEDNISEVKRVIETESHRIYNEGIGFVGEQAVQDKKQVFKTWSTMGDERVRDTHSYLDGMTVPFEEKFFTYDGDSAMYCGGFSYAENNINCRCWITLST